MTVLDIEAPIEARTRLETTDEREEDMVRIEKLRTLKSASPESSCTLAVGIKMSLSNHV